VDWIQLVLNTDQWRAPMATVMNVQIPLKAGIEHLNLYRTQISTPHRLSRKPLIFICRSNYKERDQLFTT
jgi:hypothetical protein